MHTTRTTLTLATTVALALALSGCAGPTTSGADSDGSTGAAASASDARPGAADVMFAQMMIPHHEQAVEMSEELLAKDGIDDSVRDLAEQIMAAQQPEIDLMRGWLDAWGAEELDDMGGMDHGDGMMSDDDLAILEEATGEEASRLFLQQMIVHHEGAVRMAQTEIAQGEHPDAVELAEAVVIAQTEEIAGMQAMLEGSE
ncbi:DUF305 domain-containing protein [Agromyces binzhouensis]|uniref:DUF305 domain-containing protein n=1 Tax=Agromyces binzhouensis TaxID=1817495 RepID=A0A4Q2J497_9MICO|nr:DUF305 domain-containing protein [Agromyces binzhouensis]RXZ39708.1 DUF305 domain-containing protein [Agromyces binzhouensis]